MIGIDLGTTNSCAAYLSGGAVHAIPSREGSPTTPSIVGFLPGGQTFVGAAAQRQAATNAVGTVYAAKRLMGRKFSAPELQVWKRQVSYEIVSAPNGDAWISVHGRRFSPEEISAFVLEEIKASAEQHFGEKVTAATVTVPAYFTDAQRQATRDAGAIAGLRVENIVNEPTAAALGYGVGRQEDQTFAVFDLGGGTFDISILRKTGDVFEVLATHGDTFLGGDDFDARMVGALAAEFQRQHGLDVTNDPAAMYRLKQAAEQAKRELSDAETTRINIPFLATGPNGPLHMEFPGFPRRLLESLSSTLLERLEKPCAIALEGARLKRNHIDQVLLVGGMTRMPAVRRRAIEIFGAPIRTDVDPETAVAAGAAIQCGILTGEIHEIALLDVTPYALGVRVKDSRMSTVIPKNCAIPTSVTRSFTTTRDQQLSVMIEVFQGEHESADSNTFLGSFELYGLPPRPAGNVQIDVAFELDADGLLQVKARETTTQREAKITITPSGGLPAAEVQRLARAHRGQPSLASAPQR
jgi:molecular chaperone DnaK